jgi:hypothetical protein
MTFRSKIPLVGLLISCLFAAALAENHLALNVGLSAPKSLLGLSYASGMNEINAGLKGFRISGSGDYEILPGITYNRYFTGNGFYGSLTYSPGYRNEDQDEGWNAGKFFLGAGKTFQWPSWGLNVDAGLSTAATDDFARALGFWFGGGASWRFRLD